MKFNLIILTVLFILSKCDGNTFGSLKDKVENKIKSKFEFITDDSHHHHHHHYHKNHHRHHHHHHQDKRNHERLSKFNALDFLEINGYGLGKPNREKLLTSPLLAKASLKELPKDNSELNDMVSLFQRLHNLNVTGELDNQTVSKMLAPRCGFPDLLPSSESGLPRASAFKAFPVKWNKTDLTYRFIKYNEELGEKGTKLAIKRAFDYWSEHSDLKFKEVCTSCKSELVIDFNFDDHKDGNPFDGKSGVLAHAYFPKDGRIHFDESEEFTEGTQSGINLRIVAAHEIGHALGLEHSFVRGALMYPYYGGYVENFTLHEDDRLGIASLYGKSKGSSIPPTTTSTTTTTKTTSTKKSSFTTSKLTTTTSTTKLAQNPKDVKACNSPTQAVFTCPKNNIWALVNDDELWYYDFALRNWKKHRIYDIYPKLEPGVRGGVKCSRNLTWFFKGRNVWAYKDYELQSGFPKYIYSPLYRSNPWSAINKNGKIYLLRGSHAYEFDTVHLKLVNLLPSNLNKVFPGIVDWIDSAIKYNGEHYMFKDKWVYKFDEKTNQVIVKGGQIKYQGWFPCYWNS